MHSNAMSNILSVDPVLNIIDRLAVTKWLINALTLNHRVEFPSLCIAVLLQPIAPAQLIYYDYFGCVSLSCSTLQPSLAKKFPALPSNTIISPLAKP